MKPAIKKIISISILLAIAFFFIFYVYYHISDFKQIMIINPLWLIPLTVLFLVGYLFISIQTKALILPLGIKLRNLEAYMLSIITGFYNLITPAYGGMAMRAVYLKKKHGFPYTTFLSSLAGIYVISFFITSLLGLISLFFIYQLYHIFNWIILGVFLALFLPLSFLIALSPQFRETKNKFINRFIRVANGWNLIRRDRKVISVGIIVTIIGLIINATSLMISYYVFGINLNFIQALFLTCITNLTILFIITPGNLGITEAVAVFSALILGLTPAQSLPVAILGRVVQMIVMFTLGPIFSYILLKKNKNVERGER